MEVIGRAKHDYRDIGGRVTPGAVTEDARVESNAGTTTWMWEVEYCLDAYRDVGSRVMQELLPSKYRAVTIGDREPRQDRDTFLSIQTAFISTRSLG